MAYNRPQKNWLPYIVAMVGISFTLLAWFIFRHSFLIKYYGLSPTLKIYHPWLTLILAVALSVIFAILVRVAQVARVQAVTLKQVNEDLKKEIAERINAEANRQKLEIALLQGQKLQAIGTLAGGIAHDFNNILYAIIGYAELSREELPKDSQTFKNLGKVLDGAHRGQELVSRILAFSRRQHHHFDNINLKNTIEAVLSLLRSTIPASVIIHFEPTIDAVIQGNQTQLHQVLVNIINNAVDAMDGEGTINIRMYHVDPDDPILKQFPGMQPQKYCKIEINDTGHGMDHQTIERIFEPFYTTKEVGKGTGLGLSIVHSIIKDHDGEITVTSQLGHGSTFTILLPESAS